MYCVTISQDRFDMRSAWIWVIYNNSDIFFHDTCVIIAHNTLLHNNNKLNRLKECKCKATDLKKKHVLIRCSCNTSVYQMTSVS